ASKRLRQARARQPEAGPSNDQDGSVPSGWNSTEGLPRSSRRPLLADSTKVQVSFSFPYAGMGGTLRGASVIDWSIPEKLSSSWVPAVGASAAREPLCSVSSRAALVPTKQAGAANSGRIVHSLKVMVQIF